MAKDERQAQAVAERAEEASIVASSHDAIIGMTQFGVISSCNPAAARLYGYVPADLIGKAAEVLVPPELRAGEAAILRRIVTGEKVERYRAQRVCRDGTIVTVSVAVSPIVDAAGVIVGAAASSRRGRDGLGAHDRLGARVDQQRAEVRGAHDRFRVGMDAERAKERLNVQDAQDRFRARMDVERAEERVLVEDAEDRFRVAHDRNQVGTDAERAKERLNVQDAQDRFQARIDAEQAQERVLVEDAEDRFQVEMEAELVKERARSLAAEDRFQTKIDAERAEAQSDREQLQAQLEQSQRLEVLGQLAGGVAHDFNNLLAVILNYAAFVADEIATRPDMEAVGRDVGQIRRAAERAAALTHQLLAFARREVVQARVLDLNEIVTDVEQLLRRTIGEDIVLQTTLARDLWPVLADAGRLEQVLVNLAVNARDAMNDGGTLTIDTANIVEDDSAGALPRSGRHIRLRVSDTGTGMPADVIAHAFEPFFTTKYDGTGTGLGLATVYGIVVQAGGAIEISSDLGVGTTFTITIPATDQRAVAAANPRSYQRAPKGETVLVVEDEEALREVTSRIFRGSGYRVITAVDGREAVALAAQHDGDIQLLLTDVVMPHMLGKEVAERIRQIRPDIEVLYMSGYAQPVLASQGRLDPGVHLIEKPFSAASLIEKAGQILHRRLDGAEATDS
jgi:PAS domain S-box-containing protein